MHCDPNFMELSFIKLWFFTAAVLIVTLSAPARSKFLISSILEIPPPTVNGTKQLFAVALTLSNKIFLFSLDAVISKKQIFDFSV